MQQSLVERLAGLAGSATAGRSLDDILASRVNNLDLLRIVAALMVVWGHGYFESPVDHDYGRAQDLVDWAFNSGSVAVYAFFLISGMLISASMEKHRSFLAFVVARIARLWPGFVVCAAVTLFIVIPLASKGISFDAAYLKAAGVCFRKNLLFFASGGCGGIRGAFPSTPMPNEFGFTYWTLPAEVHCYGVVLALGLLLRGRLTTTPARAAAFCGGTLAFLAAFLSIARFGLGASQRFAEFQLLGGYATYPVVFFFVGMLLFGVRRRIVVNGWAAMALSAVALVLPSSTWAGSAAFVYGVLALAGTPWLRRFRPRHDLSYGVYIYGSVIQQVVVGITGVRPVPVNALASAPVALGVAFLSWRLVEAPSLAFARRLVKRIEGRLPAPSSSPAHAGAPSGATASATPS